MYCRVIALTVRVFKALLAVVLGAAMTVNSMAMAAMQHTQMFPTQMHLAQIGQTQPQHMMLATPAMACHQDNVQVSADAPLQASHTTEHASAHACFDMLCCSLALSPLRPVLRLQLGAHAPAAQFLYTAQLHAGYFSRPDPPPRPVI